MYNISMIKDRNMRIEKNKEIYIILSYTGTALSRIIKLCTHAEYAHVSISLDKRLKKMYSFGRLKPYNPFNGGFVHEGIDTGTFKRFKNTKAEVYSLELTLDQYKKIKKCINRMKRRRQVYRFNFLGLVAVKFNIKLSRTNYFYCAEFVKYLFDEAGVEADLPELVKPMDFKEKCKLKLIFQGLLQNYKY